MTNHDVQKPNRAGAALAPAAADNDNSFVNTGKETVIVWNSSGSMKTVTFVAQHPCNYGVETSDHDWVFTIDPGGSRRFGPFNKAQFNDSEGKAFFSFPAIVDVSVAVLG